MTFNPGDKITAFGNDGTVKGLTKNGLYLEVNVEGAPGVMVFYPDGRLHKWDKEPSLKKKEEKSE